MSQEAIQLWTLVFTFVSAAAALWAAWVTANALKEAQTQFLLNSEPYLQLGGYGLSALEVGSPVEVRLQISNLGNQPARILTADIQMGTNATTIGYPNELFDAVRDQREPVLGYVSKESPYTIASKFEVMGNEQLLTKTLNGEMSIFIKGVFRYENLITKKTYIFELRVRLIPPFGGNHHIHQTLFSENYESV